MTIRMMKFDENVKKKSAEDRIGQFEVIGIYKGVKIIKADAQKAPVSVISSEKGRLLVVNNLIDGFTEREKEALFSHALLIDIINKKNLHKTVDKFTLLCMSDEEVSNSGYKDELVSSLIKMKELVKTEEAIKKLDIRLKLLSEK